MLYEYIINNYDKGEPIFLNEIPIKSKSYLRLAMKNLVDEGKLERIYNGVYFLPYTTILGTKGRISVEKYIEKKYLRSGGAISGYITGLQLANSFGFTTQNPACYEVCSNGATTKQRKQEVEGKNIIVYKPVAEITAKNQSALQFLDLMSVIDRYNELKGDELKVKLREFTETVKPDFEVVKELISFYPDRVYRNIYKGGLMDELV